LRREITDATGCISRQTLQGNYECLPTEWRGSLAGVFCKQSSTLEAVRSNALKIKFELESLHLNFRSYLLDKNCMKSLRKDVNHDIGQPLHDLIRGRILTFSGVVRSGSVPMSYWRKKIYPANSNTLHLDRDGCGFIWLACASSATPKLLSIGIEIVESTCFKHGFEPFYVVDGISAYEAYTMVAIIFDKDSEDEYKPAIDCFRECRTHLHKVGIRTYRDPLEIGK
jgi:hypothetical protein